MFATMRSHAAVTSAAADLEVNDVDEESIYRNTGPMGVWGEPTDVLVEGVVSGGGCVASNASVGEHFVTLTTREGWVDGGGAALPD